MSSSTSSASGARGHAVVLGAGMAGLAAARVLADHFDRVTVVEQDALEAGVSPRRGTPQCRHVHVLLNSGRTILNRLFPGLEDDLGAAGAPVVDGAKDVAWLMTAGWGIRYPSKYIGRIASRPLLESTIRRRLSRNPHVGFLPERAVVGLLAGDDRSRVRGIRVRPRDDGQAGAEQDVTADLVVDATGRGSRATQWLGEIGYPEPPRTEINAFLGYASRFYRLPADPNRSWRGLYVQARLPGELRSGFFFEVENGTWMCTLAGYGKDYPPTDEEGYLAFAQGLRSPVIYEVIKDAEPLTPAVAIRSTANVWRHYEKLARWPEGFVAIGDAVCAFNPVYGQGMSVGAKEAMLLDACLRDQPHGRPDGDRDGLAARFQRQLPKIIRPVWTMATGEDFRVPQVEGGRPGRSARFLYWYLDRVLRLATEDVFARQAFLEVLNLDQPATFLFHPRLIAKVILGPTGRAAAGPGAPARVAPV